MNIPESAENEERNIPMRICLTRTEWNMLHSIAVEERLMESSTEGDVYAVIETLIATLVKRRMRFKIPESAYDIVHELAECILWDEDTLCELIEQAKRFIEKNKER